MDAAEFAQLDVAIRWALRGREKRSPANCRLQPGPADTAPSFQRAQITDCCDLPEADEAPWCDRLGST